MRDLFTKEAACRRLDRIDPGGIAVFWKMITLMGAIWAAGWAGSVTVGGLIHLLPVAAAGFVVVHIMAKPPDTKFGRWRPPSERPSRRVKHRAVRPHDSSGAPGGL